MKKLLLLLIFVIISCSEKAPEKTREIVLIDLAKKDALERLKSPSTAVFIDSLSSVTQLKDDNGPSDTYRVYVHVDAQNSLGAMIRERQMLIYQDKGGDSLSKDNYDLLEF